MVDRWTISVCDECLKVYDGSCHCAGHAYWTDIEVVPVSALDEARAYASLVIDLARECMDNPSPGGARADFDYRLNGTALNHYDPQAVADDLREARAERDTLRDVLGEALGYIECTGLNCHVTDDVGCLCGASRMRERIYDALPPDDDAEARERRNDA